MNKDPLDWNLRPRLATGWNLLNACNYVEQQLKNIYLPFIVLHGTDDKITDHSSSDILYERTGTNEKDKNVKKYKDAYHHLFMEFCSDQVYHDLDEWMDQHANPINTSNNNVGEGDV